ncbi:MAG: hypothetical protein ACOYNH_06710 [Bacteroidia bacterium]|jgi:hypothetical protein
MVFLEVLIVFILISFFYLLFAPFYLEIESEINLYRFRFHRVASAKILIENSTLILQIKIAGWNRNIDLLASKIKKEKVAPVKRKSNTTKIKFRKLMAIIKSFKVNKCCISIDTGNMQLNGILYPLFFWINNFTGKEIRINFIGDNSVSLEVENNFARIFWAYISI